MATYDDVIWEIFLKLPIKSLLRFKSLSTRWNSVISDSRFIRSHLLNLSQDKSHTNFILYKYNRPKTLKTIKIVDDQFEDDGDGDNTHVLQTKQIAVPEVAENPILCGCLSIVIKSVMHCDGLLCLFPSYDPEQDARVVVWNPLTMQHKKFLRPDRFYVDNWEAFGFGYDSTVDDYKIVHVIGHHKLGTSGTKIQILRLKLRTWELTRINIPYLFDINKSPTAMRMNGFLYWIGRPILNNGRQISDTSRVILCFDLQKEKMIEETSLSAPLNSSSALGILKGCICLANNCDGFKSFEISLMKEDETTRMKTWITFMKIPSAFRFTGVTGYHSNVNLISITKNGRVLMNEYNKNADLFLSDPKSPSLRTIGLRGADEFKFGPFFVIQYIQSLVPP